MSVKASVKASVISYSSESIPTGVPAAANRGGCHAFLVFRRNMPCKRDLRSQIPDSRFKIQDLELFEMRKSTKRLVGGLALAAGAIGAIGAVVMKRQDKAGRAPGRRDKSADTWARPGMKVVFRAEVMPGRHTSDRTFHVTSLLPSGRVLLDGVSGEHAEREFQPIR